MENIFRSLALLVLTPECYDQFFYNFNFFHGDCMKAAISKGLGLAVTGGSLAVKVPQILKIISNRSGEGISLFGTSLELAVITTVSAYCYLKEFPFSSYGDGPFMAFQISIIIGLILYYKKQQQKLFLFIAFYVVVVLSTFAGFIPISVFWYMQVLNLPVIIIAKGAQAVSNYKNKSTGQLSAITLWMQFGGCLARVFTSVQDTGDKSMIINYIIASLLNGFIVFQLYYYAPKKKIKGKSKGKKME